MLCNRPRCLGLFAFALSSVAIAQVPPDIAKQLVAIGNGVCVPQTAAIYRPLHPNPPYTGVSIARDISFGPDAKDVADIFAAEKGGGSRPVLIYLPGGAGNKLQGGPNGDVFYDNIGLWASKNGMVEVNMQRRAGESWDDPAKDVSLLIQWIEANISKYKGNPKRIFMWSQSAGNGPAATYVGHPEFYGPKGIGLKGAIFMSAPGFSILPATPPAGQSGGTCNAAAGTPAAAANGKGKGGAPGGGAPGGPGGAAKGGGGNAKGGGNGKGGGRGAAAQVDPATLLARSNLPGLTKVKIPLMVSVAELDPPNVTTFVQTFKDELCKAGKCPTYLFLKDHSHISEVLSPDTADTSVTGPILKWMKGVK